MRYISFIIRLIIVVFPFCVLNPPATAIPTWQTQTIDSEGRAGVYNSLAFDTSGNPAISYYVWYGTNNTALKYAHFNGTGWDKVAIESTTTGTIGIDNSLAFNPLTGKPSISYFDNTNYDLKYASFNGTTWNTFTVDSVGRVGYYTSLAFDLSGKPAISYFDATNGDLRYARDANGDGDFADTGEKITVDSAGVVGWFTSLAFDSSGKPGISYIDRSNWKLKYAYDANGDGNFAGVNERTTIDSAGGTGFLGMETSLAFDASGKPGISYYDSVNKNVKYTHYNGTAWDKTTIDPGGGYASLAFDTASKPAVSYLGGTAEDLIYAQYSGSFWDKTTVDSSGQVGLSTHIKFDTEGNPAISYYDLTNYDLKYAHMVDASVVPEPSTIAILGIGLLGIFGYWWRRGRAFQH